MHLVGCKPSFLNRIFKEMLSGEPVKFANTQVSVKGYY